jgi:hypothetical protein
VSIAAASCKEGGISKKKLARMIRAYAIAIMVIGTAITFPACQSSTPTPTPPTHGLEFDGVDDYVSLGNATALGFTSQNFTIEAWILPSNVTRGMEIFQRCSWNRDGYRLQTNSLGGLSFFTFQSGADQASRTSDNTLVAGKWCDVAVVRQGASVRIFVNGVDKTATAGSHIDPVYSGARQTFIGTSYAPEAFSGIISEVRVWNYTRSESQIKAAMSTELTGGEAGLIGYWRLNEGSGTIAHDSTANNNTGTLYGNPVWFGGGG